MLAERDVVVLEQAINRYTTLKGGSLVDWKTLWLQACFNNCRKSLPVDTMSMMQQPVQCPAASFRSDRK